MAYQAVALKTGRGVDFGATGRPLSWYQTIATRVDAVVLDVMTAGWLRDFQNALAAGVGVMLFQGYYATDFTIPAEGPLRGREMVAAARDAQLAAGTTCWLDVESVPTSVTAEAMAAWINAWATAVAYAGYEPGLYVGPGQPLDGAQLYTLLTAIHLYWRSLSTVLTVATRGYAMVQTQGNALLDGELVDWDNILGDNLGGVVHVCRPDPTAAPASPAPSPDTQRLTQLEQQVQTLLKAQQENSRAIANWSTTFASIGKLLDA